MTQLDGVPNDRERGRSGARRQNKRGKKNPGKKNEINRVALQEEERDFHNFDLFRFLGVGTLSLLRILHDLCPPVQVFRSPKTA